MALSADLTVIAPKHRIQIIPFQYYNGALNMAIDYSLAYNIQATADPIMRFYGWNPHCISLGYHQNQQKINKDLMKSHGLELVRRPTGGSAILHANELTYSIIVPNGQDRHNSIYRVFHQILAQALRSLGYAVELHDQELQDNYLKDGARSFACFNRPAFTEIKYKDKKVVGSAQKIFRHSVLQHGSILLSGAQAKALDYLNLNSKDKKSFSHALDHSSASLKDINSKAMEPDELSRHITEQFANNGVNLIYSDYLTKKKLAEIIKVVHQFTI